VHGLARTQAGAVLSMFAVGLMVGGPVQSVCANRFGRRAVVIGVSVLMLLFSSILFMFTDSLPLYVVYILFFLISASAGSTGSLQAIICKEMFPPSIAGTAMGAGNFFTILGGACWQVLMGIAVTFGEVNVTNVYPVSGYRRIFLLCVISGVIALVFSFFVRETLPGTRAHSHSPDANRNF
jgi:MFS family permease